MTFDKRVIRVLSVLLFLSFILFLIFSCFNQPRPLEQSTGYVILKCDDIGNVFDGQAYFYDYLFSHSKALAEIGIIGNYIGDGKDDEVEQNYWQTFLDRNQVDLFCHGMDHHMNPDGSTEFYNVSQTSQFNTLALFNYRLKNAIGYTTNILGAPFNKIDANTYLACQQANFELLFWNNNRAWPCNKYDYVSADDSINHEHSNSQILSDILNLNNAHNPELIWIQMHPKWWSETNLTIFFDWLYSDDFLSDTGREVILLSEYYNDIFIPSLSNPEDYALYTTDSPVFTA